MASREVVSRAYADAAMHLYGSVCKVDSASVADAGEQDELRFDSYTLSMLCDGMSLRHRRLTVSPCCADAAKLAGATYVDG